VATVKHQFDPGAMWPYATNVPELAKVDGTNWPEPAYSFADATQDDQLAIKFKANNYGSGNLTANFEWYSRTGQTSGVVVWACAMAAETPGDAQSVETNGLATETTATSTVTATARAPTRGTVTISNLDSLAADDIVTLRIRRLQSNGSDTMTGDAQLRLLEITYSDT
jgi:hypothetical protein